jgi:solute:Na+ symporter, SSS family
MRAMDFTQSSFSLLDWGVIAVYMAVMILIGAFVARRQEDTETFFLGGRTMPWWAASLSVLATSLSAATFIGVPQMAFTGDLTYLILNLGGIVAAFVVAFLFIPPLYNAGTITIYGYLGQRFGRPSMTAASAMFLLGRLLSSGARLYIAGIAVSLMIWDDTEWPQLVAAIVLFGVVGTLYTFAGGIRAVIWTDVVQIVVVTAAALLSIWLLLRAIPLSVPEIITALRTAPVADDPGATVDKLRLVDLRLDLALPFTLWTGIFASTLVSTASYGVDQDQIQRVMTTRSAWRGGLAMVMSTFVGIPVVCLFMVIGLLLSVFYNRPDLMGAAAPADTLATTARVYPQFLLNHLPTGMRGLALAGLVAAAMSTFDSAINAMAGSLVSDLLVPLRNARRLKTPDNPLEDPIGTADDLRTPRGAVLLMGVLLTGTAVLAVGMHAAGNDDNLVNFALGVMQFALAPLLGVFCAALFTRRGNNATVLAALATGFVVVLLLQPYMVPRWTGVSIAWPWHMMLAAPASFLVCVTGRPDNTRRDVFTEARLGQGF